MSTITQGIDCLFFYGIRHEKRSKVLLSLSQSLVLSAN